MPASLRGTFIAQAAVSTSVQLRGTWNNNLIEKNRLTVIKEAHLVDVLQHRNILDESDVD